MGKLFYRYAEVAFNKSSEECLSFGKYKKERKLKLMEHKYDDRKNTCG